MILDIVLELPSKKFGILFNKNLHNSKIILIFAQELK